MRQSQKIQPDGNWRCLACSIEKPSTAHQRRKKYCSRKCAASCFGQNHKIKRNKKICSHCGISFECAQKSRKTTCSDACSKAKRESKKLFKSCLKCGTLFKYYKSQESKKYCSYKCHLESGGAFRAGLAAAEAKLRYGPKKDANHNEIVGVMRKYCAVYDLSNAGMGVPDGVAWVAGAWHLFDVKNPNTGYGKRGLNEVQKKWISQWAGGPIYLIYTAQEAENFAQGKFDGIKFFRGGAVEDVDTPD